MVTSRFNATDLSKLLKKPNACVFLRKCKRHLALTPKALNNINDSVLVHLNRLVRKFDSELDAVVLGCRNVSVLTNLGTIVDDSPHVHVDIEAEFYLFKPEKDSLLSGVVNKKSRDNIGCLVHDIFNVSIPIDPDEGIDIDNISIGQTLTFCVVVVDFSHQIPFIKGKLIDSRAQSPSKQTSGGKKRKRSDQLEVCKKIKSEIDSPLSAENNINTFTPPIKFPTSILKKSTPFGVESSPARRISFFGDVPEAPTVETNTTEGKTKKKKKKESETLLLEESPSRQKKKKMLTSFENEAETEVGIQDSRQIDSDSTGNKKVKKKKFEQTEQVNDFADEPEQDFNILQDFKVHSKKTKNNAGFENSFKLMEADEISKEINDLSASHLKTKKKKKKHEISEEVPGTYNASNILEKIKKQGNRDENEASITGENDKDQKQINDSPTQKKSKKSNKMALNKQENTSYVTGKGEHSEEKAQGSPHKRKKRISEAEGELKRTEINVAEIINKTVEDAMKIKKNKEKGTSQVDVQQNEYSLSSPKKQKSNLTNEIEPRKKILRKDKRDPLQTLSSLPELSAIEGQQPQENILQAVKLTPVDKKKKSKKISQEHVEVSDSRVHEYSGKKKKSSENPQIKRIINSSTIAGSNRLQENQYSGDGDNSFESLSPIKKSDDDDEEEEEHPSGFITSTQIEGSKTKKMVSNAKSFDNDLNEVSVRNALSDSDSFDVEEFSLSYVPQNVKQKKESKDHIASPMSSQERKSQISSDSEEATNSTKVPTKPGKRSDIDVSRNNMLVPSPSLFPSKQIMTVQSMNQKSHSKSSGADSSSSDSESLSHEQHNTLQESRIKSTEVSPPKSMVSKGVQTDEESDSVKNKEHATAKKKKNHSSDKKRKVQSRTLTTSKHMGNESNDADSTDSDLPTFLQKPTKLPSVVTKSENLPHEPVVSSSNTHKKGTRKSKITDGGPLNIGTMSNINPQEQVPKSPAKKNVFGKPKSKGIGSDTSHSDSSLLVGPKTTTLKQVHTSHKKRDPVSSGVESNVSLRKIAKPATQKQFPVSYQEHHSDSSSTDSDLPLTKAAKTTTEKQVLISHKMRKADSSSSDSDLPLAMDVPLSKAAKPATKKQFPVSFQEHDSGSSSSDSDVPSSKHLPPSKAAKTTAQKQVPASHKKQVSVSRSVDSNLPLSRPAKAATQKQVPVSYQEHHSDSSSTDSDLPRNKAAKTTTEKQVLISHKKHRFDSSSSDSDLPLTMSVPLSKVAKTTTQKQFPVSHKKHDPNISSSDSDLPSSKDLPPSKVAKTTTQKQLVSHKKHGSESSSSDSDLPLARDITISKAPKTITQKQFPVSHKKHDSDSSGSDSDVHSSKAARMTTQKQVPVSHEKHDLGSSGSDSDLPISMNLPLSKVAKMTPQKQFPVSHKKHKSDSGSDSDLPLSMDLPLSKVVKITTHKQSSASNKKSGLHSSNSVSDSSSHLKAKIPSVKKQEPLSQHKSFSSVGKRKPGKEIISQADTKISIQKKKDTNLSKHVKQESGSNEKKSSGSESNSIVKDLLAKVKTEILTPPAKDSKIGKVEERKRASKEKHGANSLVHANERKGKKTKNSKKTVDSSKHSGESVVNPGKKHEVEESSDGLESIADELLKNMLLRKEKKK